MTYRIILLSRFWPLFWLGADAVTIAPWIFVRKDLSPQNRAPLVLHECVHIAQQMHYRPAFRWVWFLAYILSPKFRFESELAAYKAQYDYAHINGIDASAWVVDQLTGPTYLWMVSRQTAQAAVDKWGA